MRSLFDWIQDTAQPPHREIMSDDVVVVNWPGHPAHGRVGIVDHISLGGMQYAVRMWRQAPNIKFHHHLTIEHILLMPKDSYYEAILDKLLDA